MDKQMFDEAIALAEQYGAETLVLAGLIGLFAYQIFA